MDWVAVLGLVRPANVLSSANVWEEEEEGWRVSEREETSEIVIIFDVAIVTNDVGGGDK